MSRGKLLPLAVLLLFTTGVSSARNKNTVRKTAGDVAPVLVPVDITASNVDTHCTTAFITWKESKVDSQAERYEVLGYVLGETEHAAVLCQSEYPETYCLASGLKRESTYIYWIVSVAGDDTTQSDVGSFTTKDSPFFSYCPGDSENVKVDGVDDEMRVYWQEPVAECLTENTVETSSHKSGAVFPAGTTEVTYALIDRARIRTCIFYIVVKDESSSPNDEDDRCKITDEKVYDGNLSDNEPYAESQVSCPPDTVAIWCQCDKTQGDCNGARLTEY
ncbi:uncharacterized protein [Ptychodera flava]|uniref:uncharacterized protein n=1 Tax=Ptychodera flava TaxID=63121 RepID=UPI00396A8341